MADSMCKYYSLLLISFLFLLAFCGVFQSTYSTDVCVSESTTTSNTTSTTTGDTTTTNSTSGAVSSAIKGVLSAQLTKVPAVMIYIYAIEMSLVVLIIFLYYFFKTKLPKDYAKMGRILRCCGIGLRLFPKLLIIVHYIVLILIVVIIAQVAGGSCANSKKLDEATGEYTDSDMQKQAVVLVIILTAFWVLLHIGGGIMRSVIHVDPFLADPEDPGANRFFKILCNKCGP